MTALLEERKILVNALSPVLSTLRPYDDLRGRPASGNVGEYVNSVPRWAASGTPDEIAGGPLVSSLPRQQVSSPARSCSSRGRRRPKSSLCVVPLGFSTSATSLSRFARWPSCSHKFVYHQRLRTLCRAGCRTACGVVPRMSRIRVTFISSSYSRLRSAGFPAYARPNARL